MNAPSQLQIECHHLLTFTFNIEVFTIKKSKINPKLYPRVRLVNRLKVKKRDFNKTPCKWEMGLLETMLARFQSCFPNCLNVLRNASSELELCRL